jgi:RNA polymerase sporulation-specific sigma factor
MGKWLHDFSEIGSFCVKRFLLGILKSEVNRMAFQKVMISGINTSELTVLKEEEKMALLREIQETGSKAARDKLIKGNLRLVLSVIQRFTGRGEDMEDLFQVGVVGLIKAINHFDLSKEVRFSTYCVPMISGELRRYLRDFNQVKVSRSLRDLAYRAMQAKERLTAKLQREPTIEQIAAEIGSKREDVVIALESITDPVSLYEPVYSESGDTFYVLDQISDRDSMENWLRALSIREAMQNLGQREKNILYLRFFRGKTQIEVAGEIGISQAQVSRLEKGALLKIKAAV